MDNMVAFFSYFRDMASGDILDGPPSRQTNVDASRRITSHSHAASSSSTHTWRLEVGN